MKNQNPPVALGTLDLQQSFRKVNRKTIYRTITYGPSFARPKYGTRACLNVKTGKVKLLACELTVEKT